MFTYEYFNLATPPIQEHNTGGVILQSKSIRIFGSFAIYCYYTPYFRRILIHQAPDKMSDKIQVLRELRLPVCTFSSCEFAVKTTYLAGHLKDTHDFVHEDAVAIMNEISVVIDAIVHSPSEKEIATRYLSAGGAGSDSWATLAPLPLLRIAKGWRCLFCTYCAISMDTLWKHMQAKHVEESKSASSSDMFRGAPEITLQSVFGGSKKRWFEVGYSGDYAEAESCPGRFIAEFHGDSGLEHVGDDPSRMNAFLATVRFDSVLQGHGISEADSWELVHGTAGEDVTNGAMFKRWVNKYFSHAFRACQKTPVITSHSVQGSRLRVSLERNTLDRYESEAVLLLKFAANCIKEKKSFVSEILTRKVSELQSVWHEDESVVLRKVHALMCTIFLDVIEPRQGDVGFIGVYVACASIVGGPSKELLRYAEASEISPVLAALKYCIRIVAVSEVVGLGETESGVESWKLINARTADSLVDTGATYVAYISHLAHSIMPSEGTRCRFRVCSIHETCGFIDNIEISLNSLSKCIRDIQERARLCLERKLLKGIELGAGFCTEASGLDDALQNSGKGFWFGKHPANARSMLKWGALLWNHRGSDFWSREDGKLDVSACNSFLNGCEELQRYLFTLLQLTAGSPSRASECSGLRVMNDAAASRNMYLCDGQLVLTSFYSKTRSLNDGASRPIARFPDSETQLYILSYLLIVRPLEYCICKALLVMSEGSAEIDDQRVYLFARRGEAVPAKVLCSWFKDTIAESGIEGVGVSQYRQYQTGMVKNFGLAGREGLELAAYAQAGHSEETAHRLYGVSDADFRHLTGTELEAYRLSSQRWHESLSLFHGSAMLSARTGRDEGLATANKNGTGKTCCKEVDGCFTKLILERLESMEATLSKMVSMKRTIDFDTEPAGNHDLGTSPKRGRLMKSRAPISEHQSAVSNEMWEALGLFLGVQEGSKYDFKSVHQREAVEMARLRKTDGLIVMPTGGGKSLVFMLPCYVEPKSVTLVIVPLVALQRDMLARCRRAGIDAGLWRDRERVGIRIIIVSVEHVETEEYAQYVRFLARGGKLARIVIDEVHLVCMWSHFREQMHGLAGCVRPNDVHVPLLMLTATAPPLLVPTITSMCGADMVKVVRAPSFRPNIRYSCLEMEAGNNAAGFLMAVAGKVIEIVDRYRDESPKSRVVVYALTRAAVEALASIIECDPRTCACRYHAGMDEQSRKRSQDDWTGNDDDSGKFKVMIATSAFGTGIDYPSIRAVIHVNGARNLIEFYQESGRAGRDGLPADSIVLFGRNNGLKAARAEGGDYEAVHKNSLGGKSGGFKENSFGEFHKYLLSDSVCRRKVVEGFCEGIENGRSCVQMRKTNTDVQICDICCDVGEGNTQDGSTCPSSSNADRCNMELSPSGNTSAETMKDGIYAAGICVRASASGAQASRKKAETEAEALRSLAIKLGNVCAVCTVRSGTEVRHREATQPGDMRRLPCRKNRCDRCGVSGHYWDICTLNPKPEWGQGCTRCGISKHLGITVHPEGQFGRPTCGIQTILSIAILSWERDEKRNEMKALVPEVAGSNSIKTFAAWLRCCNSSFAKGYAPLGLARLTVWIDQTYSSGSTLNIPDSRVE